jgi:hypothetical protein
MYSTRFNLRRSIDAAHHSSASMMRRNEGRFSAFRRKALTLQFLRINDAQELKGVSVLSARKH